MRVLEVMRVHLVSVPAQTSLRDVVDMFDVYHAECLPVVGDDGLFVGVLYADRVLAQLLGAYTDGKREVLAGLAHGLADAAAIDHVRTPVVSVDEQDDVAQGASIMCRDSMSQVAVTSQGRLTGMLCRVDICQAILDGELS